MSGWNPLLPLILAAWWDTSSVEKQCRLEQHILWADIHGQLKEIAGFLTSLNEKEWFHSYD
jgi:hypothetical protein